MIGVSHSWLSDWERKDYNHFMKRSAFYRNLFNSKTGFFQPKNDKGEWIEPFDPYKYGANGGYPFTEGNAWQYFWYVPQNIPDLISLTGGTKPLSQSWIHSLRLATKVVH